MRRFAYLLVLAACGDDLKPATQIDAAIDAPPDVPVDGRCGNARDVTGELVDLDSTTASFLGVNNAVFTQRGGSATDTTAPNGRFEMCVAATTTYVFDVDAPADYLDAIAYLDAESIDSSTRTISFRTMTATRAAAFYTSRGLTFDATRAHLLIFQTFDTGTFTLANGVSHGVPQGGHDPDNDGAYTWSTDQGRYVLFPNVDATGGTVSLIGDTSGQHQLPVAAGKLTLAAIHTVFF